MTVQNFEQGKPDLLRRLRQYIDDAPRDLSRLSRNLERFARDQPLAASLAALAGGFLVARVVARR